MPPIHDTHLSLWSAGDEWIGRLDLNDITGNLRAMRIMRGLQTVSDPQLGTWSGNGGGKPLYAGIRSANIFLENIDAVPDMTEKERDDWKAQVKFLKAYYSFLLIKQYGPIIIADDLIQADATTDELFQRRSKIEESFTFVINLMDEAIPDLNEKASSKLFGQVDQIVAKAIKARVLLYRASAFYNGNQEYFGDFFDFDGEPFFPLKYDKEKWKNALDAINEALDACHQN